MKFYLNINNQWVTPEFDINSDNNIQLNWTFDNLNNPADLVGEYSYEFTLPYTPTNRKIFKHFEQLDSVSDVNNVNVFHPNVLIPYIIQTTNDVISTGEAYLSEISEEGYVLNLNGSLCTVFQKLLNSGWNKSKADADDEYFLFDDIDAQDLRLDRNLIKAMWENDTPNWQLDPTLADITEFVTSVPMYQGLYDNFDSNRKVAYVPLVGDVILDAVAWDEQYNKVDTGNGLNEWQMQEFRSYEQNFGVYIQKLFAWYALKCSEICDYDLILDDRWYNNVYEYLQKMVYVLGKCRGTASELDNIIEPTLTFSTSYPPLPSPQATVIAGISGVTANFTTPNVNVEQWQAVSYDYNLNYHFDFMVQNPDQFYLCYNWDNPMLVTTKVVDNNNNTIATYHDCYYLLPNFTDPSTGNYYVIENNVNHNLTPAGYTEHIVRYTALPCTEGLEVDIPARVQFESNFTGNFHLEISSHMHNEHVFFTVLASQTFLDWSYFYAYPPAPARPTCVVKLDAVYTLSDPTRSNQSVNLDKLFGDISPFSILLKYTKMLGMLWIVDDYNKIITVKRRCDHFYDLINEDNNTKNPHDQQHDLFRGFYDISDLVDMENARITPLAWTTRDVTMNYDDADDSYISKYQQKYKRSYGSVLIKTENYLNKDSEDLFCNTEYDTINPSCVVQPYYRPYGYVCQKRKYKIQLESMCPTNATEQGTNANINNNFYFRLANQALPGSMHRTGFKQDKSGNYAVISDDSLVEIYNGTYTWHDETYYTNSGHSSTDVYVRVVPCFHTVRNGFSLQFAEPYEAYYNIPLDLRRQNADTELDTQIKYVYDREWSGYISEIYNVENKTLEVDTVVNGELYRRLKSVPLVTINDCAYLVVGIEGWNEYNETTKLKLRQISKYNSLTVNNYSGGVKPAPSEDTDDGSEPKIIPDTPVDIQTSDDVGYVIVTPTDELWPDPDK